MHANRSIWILPFIFFLLHFVISGQASSTIQPTVEIKKSSIYLNGKIIKLPIASVELEQILGKPDRSVKGIRKVSTWDKLGMIGYQKIDSDGFIEIGVIFDLTENSFEFSPAIPFNGSFVIDGVKVTKASSLNSFNRGKKGAKFVPIPFVKILSEYRSGGVYLVMWQSEKAKVIANSRILQVSISREEKLDL